jgi:hypothetical protein
MKYKMLFALKQNFYSQSYLFSYCLVPESEWFQGIVEGEHTTLWKHVSKCSYNLAKYKELYLMYL